MIRLKWDAVLVGAVAATLVGAIGGALTDLGPWYQSLRSPDWKPPDSAFGAIWTTIFALTVVAGAQGWQGDPARSGRRWIGGLFALNAVLNVLWTVLFFQFRRPDLALIEVAGLWLSILALILVLGRRSGLAAALLLPYLAWVAIAAVLNYQVIVLNGPFG